MRRRELILLLGGAGEDDEQSVTAVSSWPDGATHAMRDLTLLKRWRRSILVS